MKCCSRLRRVLSLTVTVIALASIAIALFAVSSLVVDDFVSSTTKPTTLALSSS
jgi:hypothetical protein